MRSYTLQNGDFETWNAGTKAAPDNWQVAGSGAVVDRSLSNYKTGSYGVSTYLWCC